MNDEARLAILLQAYAAERADDTPTTASFLALVGTVLGFLTIIGFVLTHDSAVPAWAIAVLPVSTIPFIAYGTIVAHVAQIRGAVIDDYEKRLRALQPPPPTEQIAPPYGHGLLNRMVWQHWFGRTAIGLASLALVPLYVGVLIECYRHSHTGEPTLALASLIGCSVALLILLALFVVALFPERARSLGIAELSRQQAIVDPELKGVDPTGGETIAKGSQSGTSRGDAHDETREC